jgi:hypothetical protein
MAVYREGFKILELLQKQQVNIFRDACDYGVPVIKGEPNWLLVNQLVTTYGDIKTRRENRYSTGRSVEAKITLIDEWAVSDERKTINEATETYLVTFVSCNEGMCRGFDGYVNIILLNN